MKKKKPKQSPGARGSTLRLKLTRDELRQCESAASREGRTLAHWMREELIRAARGEA